MPEFKGHNRLGLAYVLLAGVIIKEECGNVECWLGENKSINCDTPDPPQEKTADSTAKQNVTQSNSQQSHQKPNNQGCEQPLSQTEIAMPAPSCPRPAFSDLVNPKHPCVFQMDLLSPSKEFKNMMECSPCSKIPVADNHTGLTPGMAELQPSKAKRPRRSGSLFPEEGRKDSDSCTVVDSPVRQRKLPRCKTESYIQNKSDDSPFLVPSVPRSLFQSKSEKMPTEKSPILPHKFRRHKSDLRPCKLFSDSPQRPSSEVEAMMDEIDVSMTEDDGSEGFLRRQKKWSLRRCNSLEIRKQLSDMSNTPTSSIKSTFKRALSKDFKEVEESNEEHPKSQGSRFGSGEYETESDHERIKNAVDALQSSSLIADGSRSYCLPLIPGKHSDLKNIHHETLAKILTYPVTSLPDIDKLTIVDCRYPYEHNGGHVKGAINIYTEDAMTKFLNKEIQQPVSTCGKHILIFYCEFSSQRGPNLYRHLRNCDRLKNADHYPKLTFPEIYLLFGGYKEFFLQHPDLCNPSSYTPMIDEKYASDLRHFRAKAKSWAAGEKLKALKKL